MKQTVYRVAAPVRLTIAVVADLHNGKGNRRAGKAVIDRLKKRRPDLIAIPGDVILGRRPKETQLLTDLQKDALRLVEQCVSIAPTFVSFGNHEWVLCKEDLARLHATGAVVLDNEYVVWQGIAIGGLTSATVTEYRKFRRRVGGRYPYRSRRLRASSLVPKTTWLDGFAAYNGYKILLSHHPEYWSLQEPKLAGRHIDLVLSGHAHGGQARLFGQGLFAPGQGLLPPFTSGVHQGPHGKLVISRGLSNPAPLPRLFNPPELVYVELG